MNQVTAEIEASALHHQLKTQLAPIMIDVREPWEYAQGTLPGAVLAPLGQLPGGLDPLKLPLDAPIVVFCHHGMRSLRARDVLLEGGFTQVQSLRGGIDAWACKIDASVGRY